MTAGLSWRESGNITPQEVSLASLAKQEQLTEFIRLMAWLLHVNAALTAVGFNDPKRFPSLEDAFPGLFEPQEQQDWRIMKERIEGWATMKGRYVSETQ